MLMPPPGHRLPLGTALDAFMRALSLSQSELATWLQMPADRLPRLAACPLPTAESGDLTLRCIAIARAVGCDAWSLKCMLESQIPTSRAPYGRQGIRAGRQ